MSYLDNAGLTHFWEKAKAKFSLKSEGVKSITRNGLTFTVTRSDDTTFTFSQQDETVEKTATTPKMNGTADIGSETRYAAGDHVHPTDTTRASTSDLSAHTGNTNIHITSSERSAWNAKAETTPATTSENGLMSASDKTKLNGIANSATANSAYTTNPAMDGTASAGSSDAYARGDHVHPTDTSRAAESDVTSTARAKADYHLGFYIDQDGDLCQA